MEKYKYVRERELSKAMVAVEEMAKCFAESGVSLTGEELNHLREGEINYQNWLRERLRIEVASKHGMDATRLGSASGEAKSLVRAEASLAGHRYDELFKVLGWRNLDGGPWQIVSMGSFTAKEHDLRFPRFPRVEQWLRSAELRSNKLKLTDLFTHEDGKPHTLHPDWKQKLTAAYTSVIPPEYRTVFDTLHDKHFVKGVQVLREHLQDSTSLYDLFLAMNKPEYVSRGLTWKPSRVKKQ